MLERQKRLNFVQKFSLLLLITLLYLVRQLILYSLVYGSLTLYAVYSDIFS